MWGILAALFFNSWSIFLSQAICLKNLRDECDPNIASLIESSPVMKRHFVRLVLYDEDQKWDVCTYNAEKYFTVASNTKLLSFYTGLKISGETLPALRYAEQGIPLFSGERETFLCYIPYSKASTTVDFLRIAPQKIYYAAGNYTGNFYGNGWWMYDNYNARFQPEKSELPIFGNVVNIYVDSMRESQTIPTYFKKHLHKE